MKSADKLKILVVEDSQSDLFLIQQGFLEVTDFDLELVAAGNLSESLALAEQGDFDVALLDLGLPDSQGLDTFRTFSSRHGQLPVLILTGLNDVAVSEAALQEGAQDYLIKSRLSSRQLSQAIRHALERNKLSQKLKETSARMRKLALRSQQILEEERKRISRDVHDGLGQLLTALKIDLHWIGKQIGAPPSDTQEILDRINGTGELVERAIHSVQEIAINLRPNTLDQLGIVEAIRGESARFQKRTGIDIVLDLPEQSRRDNQALDTAMFRIFQELLTNIARHAQADTVHVKIDYTDKYLTFDVIDNGVGISEDAIQAGTSLGLMGIFERAEEQNGHVSIFNGESGGTHVSINFPADTRADRKS